MASSSSFPPLSSPNVAPVLRTDLSSPNVAFSHGVIPFDKTPVFMATNETAHCPSLSSDEEGEFHDGPLLANSACLARDNDDATQILKLASHYASGPREEVVALSKKNQEITEFLSENGLSMADLNKWLETKKGKQICRDGNGLPIWNLKKSSGIVEPSLSKDGAPKTCKTEMNVESFLPDPPPV